MDKSWEIYMPIKVWLAESGPLHLWVLHPYLPGNVYAILPMTCPFTFYLPIRAHSSDSISIMAVQGEEVVPSFKCSEYFQTSLYNHSLPFTDVQVS